jgi:hypothetical protein
MSGANSRRVGRVGAGVRLVVWVFGQVRTVTEPCSMINLT